MLTEIRIESLGAIPVATAEFDSGLTVLTGETGAGKTMVVTSLHLLGGARADANRVRAGADRAVVEGRFLTTDPLGAEPADVTEILDSSGAQRDDDGSVIAARSVTSDGRSRAYLGGRSVPAKSLASFTAGLLTVHGQNDQLRLMRPEQQLAALDRFASEGPGSIEALLTTYRKLREEWLTARRDLIDRTNRARELAQEADRLGFALNEIDTVDPKPGEDDQLTADIHRLSELDALRDAAGSARGALAGADSEGGDDDSDSAIDRIAKAKVLLEATDDAALQALAPQLAEALAVVSDVARELTAFTDELPSDASTLEEKLARQGLLRTLTRKYAADLGGVIAWAQEARGRLAEVDTSEETLNAIAARVDRLAGELAVAAMALSKARAKAAKALGKAVTAELAGLAMDRAVFTIAVEPIAARADDSAPLALPSGQIVHAGSAGTDAVEFGFAAHRDNPLLPLAKSASGGELSRVMLALEVVLAASTAGTTMVFDEVDAGVGGRAAVQIGRRLAKLAHTHQVIVVTHLPQVAAFADIHLTVDRVNSKGSGVRRLDDEDRVAELARMLAGLGDSDTGRAHARELLDAARSERG
ncbi:DNA repair protein RecN [Mycolicibacterium phlei]|uniref:DNA repair protein RecN n=1 Tax=Mycobacteroides chelonae TaxID=1774 RepID=F8SQM4_MYCCH|nr:DNA repair protein RecN [Mycobacteroides chelonae]VEG16598.1 DNA repair protein RecN [Mycolicibacterium phlei]AEI54752.1 DNA repair protein RecN [Mycobacteroides chelonae]AKC39037.1 DNA recombination protein RecN [Mycobacteroides chelonae]ANA98368.1 DNA recombination protein RecN [Mycobacteroides chelonae CCUG 47445]OLT72174.1 DNA repair protein RecN [Mycobacteroides chelonae]